MPVSLEHESVLWDAGARVVVGIDEVGRGALAGPVSVGVCALERCDTWPEGLADSKLLSLKRRIAMNETLANFGVARAVGHATPREIDDLGINGALRLAGNRALAAVTASGIVVDAILLDGKHDWLTPPADDLFAASADAGAEQSPPAPLPPVTMVIKGDNLCASIAAGSVIAKVERDGLMAVAHDEHPEYGWCGNKGYGAESHLAAIRTLGATDYHRRSWKLPEREN
ncbi:ribonuclease HII [Demequina aurantiaca]|uniref:ribonuclease HII n=1 Tax=Demequina aurantiaca TaxID=676200 RepID=UPI0007808689|nr:ribonuclease HII [Demequina aurantiaca]